MDQNTKNCIAVAIDAAHGNSDERTAFLLQWLLELPGMSDMEATSSLFWMLANRLSSEQKVNPIEAAKKTVLDQHSLRKDLYTKKQVMKAVVFHPIDNPSLWIAGRKMVQEIEDRGDVS